MTVFKLDDTSDSVSTNWTLVSTLLSAVSGDITVDRALEWEFQPYAEPVDLASGHVRGLGLPVVTWKFKALRPEQRENLKDFCSGLSANVYIQTPTNETAAGVRTWKKYQAIMKWMTSFEIVGVNHVEQVTLQFMQCVEVFT